MVVVRLDRGRSEARQGFTVDVRHFKGRDKVVADALSSAHVPYSAFTLQRSEQRDNMLSIYFQWRQANRLRGAL